MILGPVRENNQVENDTVSSAITFRIGAPSRKKLVLRDHVMCFQ